ncbi:MAG: DNA polymerase III subunit epsilon [Gammaproteobacteria bacterium]|nr:DNA polymerase III subunit epsilon [Gammaproteobacteria bacterium]
MRQVVLDTETTGLEPEQGGHRVIELGAVEIVDRKITGGRFHEYIDPQREIDDAAFDVHGLDADSLAGKPKFAEVADAFLAFVEDSEVIIHNAPFDLAFIDYELSLLDRPGTTRLLDVCTVTDSLAMARRKHPGQKNGLDALCRRYEVDNSARELHGALLDAEILADVYLRMTGGQMSLFEDDDDARAETLGIREVTRLPEDRPAVAVVLASAEEISVHEAYLDNLDAGAENGAVWRRRGLKWPRGPRL